MNSREQAKTRIGGCLTLLSAIIILIYAGVKFEHMIEYRNPIINVKHEIGVLKNDTLNMTQPGFMIAIGVMSWYGNSVKNDSRYIKPWAFNVNREDDRAYNWNLISMHPCTDEDYEKF